MLAAFKLLSWKLKLGWIAAILLVIGVAGGSMYYVAYNKGLNKSELIVAQYEKRLSELREQVIAAQAQVDVKIRRDYTDRVQFVDRVVEKTTEVVVERVPEQFTLSKGWIYAYNQSIRGLELDPSLASDNTPSSVSEMRALAGTIAPNNGVCLANTAQLNSLQQWIRETEAVREEVNSN